MAGATGFDREPPCNIEAERFVLGAIILDQEALLYARSALDSPKQFYDAKNRSIYKAILHLHDTDRQTDLITLRGYLRLTGKIEAVGGESYLARLTTDAGSKWTVEYYATIVRNLFTQRNFMEECRRQFLGGYEATDIDAYVVEAQEALARAAQGLQARNVLTPEQMHIDHGAWLDDLIRAKGDGVGIRMGIPELDIIIRQGMSDDLVIIAGKTSSGKTSLLLSIAVNMAMAGHPGYIASLETNRDKLMRRLNAICCPHEEFLRVSRAGRFHARYELMRAYEDTLRRLPLFIDDTSLYIEDLIFSLKRHLAEHPETEWIAIDYLQYMHTREIGKEYEKINYILNCLKEFKKKYRLPIILLSQLNRNEPYGKEGLTLANLRGSGNIEQDADMVLMLDKGPTSAEEMEDEPLMYCKVLKQRDGATGWARLRFVKPAFLYISYDKGRKMDMKQGDLLTEGGTPF